MSATPCQMEFQSGSQLTFSSAARSLSQSSTACSTVRSSPTTSCSTCRICGHASHQLSMVDCLSIALGTALPHQLRQPPIATTTKGC